MTIGIVELNFAALDRTRRFIDMASISSAANVETTAFAILRQMGFLLNAIDMGVGNVPLLVAQNGEHDLRGETAIELLGLLSICKSRGEEWQPSNDEVEQCMKFWDDFHRKSASKS
jgi:hypothetical protein